MWLYTPRQELISMLTGPKAVNGGKWRDERAEKVFEAWSRPALSFIPRFQYVTKVIRLTMNNMKHSKTMEHI